MGARSFSKGEGEIYTPPTVFKGPGAPRHGGITEAERTLVRQFVADQPREVTGGQIDALAKAMRRTPETIRGIIADAKSEFAASAVDYVQMHKQAVQTALANGDAKSLAVAEAGSRWAIEKQSFDGVKVIERDKGSDGSGTKILIGIKLGGANPKREEIQGEIIEGVAGGD